MLLPNNPRIDPRDAVAAAWRDLFSAGVLIGLCLLVLLWLIPTQIATVVGEYDLSPAFFPRLGVLVVLALSVLLFVVRMAAIWSASADARGKPSGILPILIEVTGWAGAGTVAVLVLPYLGFFVTAVLIVVIGTRVCGRRDWLPGIALALVFTWVVQTAAWQMFTVQLP